MVADNTVHLVPLTVITNPTASANVKGNPEPVTVTGLPPTSGIVLGTTVSIVIGIVTALISLSIAYPIPLICTFGLITPAGIKYLSLALFFGGIQVTVISAPVVYESIGQVIELIVI